MDYACGRYALRANANILGQDENSCKFVEIVLTCSCVYTVVVYLCMGWCGWPHPRHGQGFQRCGCCKSCCHAIHTGTGVKVSTATDEKGVYAFPLLPVGRYDIAIDVPGFRPYRFTGIVVDSDSASIIDATLTVGTRADSVIVEDTAAHAETSDTQMGEVISGSQIAAVPLNGRSYTDLLALQPGVAPATSLTSGTVQDIGASALSPSGDLNPGTISINGQREFSNAFSVNGSDVEEDVNCGSGDYSQPRLHRRVPHSNQQFRCGDGRPQRRADQRSHEIGYQSISWRHFRISPQHESGRAQLFFSRARPFRSESIRRDLRRTDTKKQSFLFRRLSGHSINAGNRYRSDSRAFVARSERQSVRSGEFVELRRQRKHSAHHRKRCVLGQRAFTETGIRRLRQ